MGVGRRVGRTGVWRVLVGRRTLDRRVGRPGCPGPGFLVGWGGACVCQETLYEGGLRLIWLLGVGCGIGYSGSSGSSVGAPVSQEMVYDGGPKLNWSVGVGSGKTGCSGSSGSSVGSGPAVCQEMENLGGFRPI
jgi:hypothetical protein